MDSSMMGGESDMVGDDWRRGCAMQRTSWADWDLVSSVRATPTGFCLHTEAWQEGIQSVIISNDDKGNTGAIYAPGRRGSKEKQDKDPYPARADRYTSVRTLIPTVQYLYTY